MTKEQQVELVKRFLLLIGSSDTREIATLITNDFVYERMVNFDKFPRYTTRNEFLTKTCPYTSASLPDGFNLTFGTALSEGNELAIQAESDQKTAKGKRYNNLYHHYFRFEGNKIAYFREYNDWNHVFDVFDVREKSR